jgi:hypothetical protein
MFLKVRICNLCGILICVTPREVEKIVAEKSVMLCKANKWNTKSSKFYLVQWLGYSDASNTWEPEAHVSDDVSELPVPVQRVVTHSLAHRRMATTSEAKQGSFLVTSGIEFSLKMRTSSHHIHFEVNRKRSLFLPPVLSRAAFCKFVFCVVLISK